MTISSPRSEATARPAVAAILPFRGAAAPADRRHFSPRSEATLGGVPAKPGGGRRRRGGSTAEGGDGGTPGPTAILPFRGAAARPTGVCLAQ